jgi:hypothetical protein
MLFMLKCIAWEIFLSSVETESVYYGFVFSKSYVPANDVLLFQDLLGFF